MPVPTLNYNDTIAVSVSSSSTESAVPSGQLRRFKDSDKIWVCSEMRTQALARHRLLSQEFFRLLLPHQPETRLVIDSKTNDAYIFTEQVSGFKPLPEINDGSEKCIEGEYKRYRNDFARGSDYCPDESPLTIGYSYSELGSVLILSVLLHQLNLSSPQNLGIDSKKRVVMTDGETCFPGIRDADLNDMPGHITPSLLNSLPIPDGYMANEWFDYIKEGHVTGYNWNEATYKAVLNPIKDLAKEPRFREEMNRTMLKILVMPNWFFDRFFALLMPRASKQYSEYLCERRDQLRHSALQNSSFQDWLITPKARKTVRDFLNHVREFKAAGGSQTDPCFIKTLNKEVNQNSQSLFNLPFENIVSYDGDTKVLNWPQIKKSVFQVMVGQRFLSAKRSQFQVLGEFFERLYNEDPSTLDDEFVRDPDIAKPHDMFKLVLDMDPFGKKIAKGVISTYIRSLDDPFRIIALGVLAQMLNQDLNTVMKIWSDSYFANSNKKDNASNEYGYQIPGRYFDLFQAKWDDPVDLLLKRDELDNNNLMLAIKYEPLAITPFLNVIKQATPLQRSTLLTQANTLGYTPLTIAIMHQPEQAEQIFSMVVDLNDEEVRLILNEKTMKGNESVLSLTNRYYPSLVERLTQLADRANVSFPETSNTHKRAAFFREAVSSEPQAKAPRGHSFKPTEASSSI